MSKLKTAVVGVGHLGKFHAQKYLALAESELIAVCDTDLARAQALADTLDVAALQDYTLLADQVQAVSIVTPTEYHAEIAEFFIRKGVHVLVEKPMTLSTVQAERLIHLAKQHEVVLQVGHLERFNPAFQTALPFFAEPCFIEAERLAPFKARGTDVNVILDMMIHDLDLVLSLVASPLRHVTAHGAPIISTSLDIAHARLEFENGCIAQLTASRVSEQIERKFRVLQKHNHISLDLQQKTCRLRHKSVGVDAEGMAFIEHHEKPVTPRDALEDQIHAFLMCVLHRRKPWVSGHEGKQALSLALKITELAQQSHTRMFSSTLMGV